MSEDKVLFEKEYSGESLIELEQDISNAMVDWDVPVDENNIPIVTFKVTVTRVED